MNVTARFFIYAPFALFVGLAVGLSVHWWVTAEAFSKRLDAANGREVIPGVTLHFASKTVAGFPFRLDATFKTIEIDVATPHGPASWRAPDLAMHALTYGRAQTILEAAGRQTLNWTGDDGRRHELPFVPGSMRASAFEDEGGLWRFDLDIVGAGSTALTAGHTQLHVRRTPGRDALDLFVSADDVHLGPRLRSAFGDTIRTVSVSATIAPGHAFDALRGGHVFWPKALDDWRHAGGSAQIDQAHITWVRLDAMGSGRLALDEERRVAGLLDFKFAGIENWLDRAAREHVIAGSNKGLASALLARTAVAGSDDMGRVGAVIGFKDGIAYVGDTPAGTLAPMY